MSGLVRGADGVYREPPGYAALWLWFGLSRASWLTMPRVLMHEMPDDWQARMAELLSEYDAAWNFHADCGESSVVIRHGGKFAPMPEWIDYRHPDGAAIDAMRTTATDSEDRT